MKMNKAISYHVPVLLNECIEGLNIRPDGIYVDLTFGGGGHSKEIFKHLQGKGLLVAFDQDQDAAKNAWEAPNFKFIPSNFSFLKNQLRLAGIHEVDGILADLGVSSHQFDAEKRGFSIHADEKLDMRMNQAATMSALELIHTYSEEQLYAIFRNYGEIQPLKKLVDTILKERQVRRIQTTKQLVDLIYPIAPRKKEHKFLAQVFQAIRIEVNDEIHALEKMLEQAEHVLKPGGRLVVMSYHSLEDRLVKNFLKRGNLEGKINKDFYGNILRGFEEINRKPIIPKEDEIEKNPRSRSAKLRIAEKKV